MHVQDQILNRVVALLTAELGAAYVYAGEVHPLTPETMPGVAVWIPDDRPDGGTLEATTKQAMLHVAAFAEGNHSDDGGSVLAVVESALYGDQGNDGRFLNSLVTNIVFEGQTRNYDGAAAVKHTKSVIRYALEYQTEDGNAEQAR